MAVSPVFLPGKFHGQSSLVGYSPWGHRELDTTEQLGIISTLNTEQRQFHSKKKKNKNSLPFFLTHITFLYQPVIYTENDDTESMGKIKQYIGSFSFYFFFTH